MSWASEARRAAGLSVKQAAQLSGYKEATIRHYERANVSASYMAALRLSEVYQCAATVFLAQAEPAQTAKSKSRKEGERKTVGKRV